jgi:hypothetical protein
LSLATVKVLSFAAVGIASVWAADCVWSVVSAGLPSPASGVAALSFAAAVLSFAASGGLSLGMRSSLHARQVRLAGQALGQIGRGDAHAKRTRHGERLG